MGMPLEQLTSILKDYATVYLVTPGSDERVSLIKNATVAARDSGVGYILVVSLPIAIRPDKIFGK